MNDTDLGVPVMTVARAPLGYDDFTDVDDQPADPAAGLVSLGFITAALRRSAWFWCAIAVAGLLIGFGSYVESAPCLQGLDVAPAHAQVPTASPGTAI